MCKWPMSRVAAPDLMSRTSTRSQQQRRALDEPASGGAERLLVVAILLIGVVGLAVSYSGRGASADSPSANAGDTITADGELRGDHMILHLNQRVPAEAPRQRTSRF